MSRIPAIAVVDDDEDVREALSELMMVEGFGCRVFDGAGSFLERFDHEPFDCLITDIRMPGMSGIDLLEHLRSLGSTLPVIILTSVLDSQCRGRSLALGARAWLTKPVADSVLLGAVMSVL